MAQQQITFTKEHKAQLDALLTAMLFSGSTITGVMGTTLNAHQLLQETSINTLQKLYISTSKEIENTSKLDRWSMTEYQQSKLAGLKNQAELLDLLIGFKKFKEVKEENARILKDKKLILAQYKEEKKTPEEKIKELEAEIATMEE